MKIALIFALTLGIVSPIIANEQFKLSSSAFKERELISRKNTSKGSQSYIHEYWHNPEVPRPGEQK